MNQEEENSLHLDSLELVDFRNYSHLSLNGLGSTCIFVGENAVGKTNVLEAIYIASSLKSFRATHMDQIVRYGKNRCVVHVMFLDGKRQLEETVIINEGKRTCTLNGKAKQVQDLKGLFPSVLFTPDDLFLVKGSHTQRRASLDNLGSLLSKNYYRVKNDYQKLVKQKNQALKDELSEAYVESINEVLARVGSQFCTHRIFLCEKIRPLLKEFYEHMGKTGESLDLQYVPSWEGAYESDERNQIEVVFKEQLRLHAEEERSRKKSIVGPHADGINFLLNGKNALHFASQGQQRSIVLSYKLAELHSIQQTNKVKPMLLLDDVMSELDDGRRRAFLDFVEKDVQSFISTTSLSYFDTAIISAADVYELPFEENRL